MVRAVRNLPEGVRYPRKKGYAKRYVRSAFRKNRLQLLLGIVFLLGIVTGCSIAGQTIGFQPLGHCLAEFRVTHVTPLSKISHMIKLFN